MAQQAVEHTSQSDNRITWATIKDNMGDIIHQLTRMKFLVCMNMYNIIHSSYSVLMSKVNQLNTYHSNLSFNVYTTSA